MSGATHIGFWEIFFFIITQEIWAVKCATLLLYIILKYMCNAHATVIQVRLIIITNDDGIFENPLDLFASGRESRLWLMAGPVIREKQRRRRRQLW